MVGIETRDKETKERKAKFLGTVKKYMKKEAGMAAWREESRPRRFGEVGAGGHSREAMDIIVLLTHLSKEYECGMPGDSTYGDVWDSMKQLHKEEPREEAAVFNLVCFDVPGAAARAAVRNQHATPPWPGRTAG